MKDLSVFACQNWLITPAAALAKTSSAPVFTTGGEPQPELGNIHATDISATDPHPVSIYDQLWMLTLSGVVVADFKGSGGAQSLNETLSFIPDLAGLNNQGTSGPLAWAINHYQIPTPFSATDRHDIAFAVEQWAPFASLSSIFDQGEAINSGYAVDAWRLTPFVWKWNVLAQQPINNVFSGINVNVSLHDSDAQINRIAYHITLLGKIVFILGPSGPEPERLVKVPFLEGMTETKAVRRLFEVRLQAHSSHNPTPNPHHGDWHVQKVDPKEGSMVPVNSRVDLTLAPSNQ